MGGALDASTAPNLPVDFGYRSAPSCPDRNAFVGLVATRLGEAPDEALVVRLNRLLKGIDIAMDGTMAEIRFQDTSARRRVRGQNCDEVAAAASLIVTMALGSNAHTERRAAGRAPPSPSLPNPINSADATPSSPETHGSVTTTVPVTSRSISPAPPPPQTPGSDLGSAQRGPGLHDHRPARKPYSLALGALAGANTVAGPGVVPELGVSAALDSRRWSARLEGGYSRSSAETNGRRANLTLWVGRASGCALFAALGRAWPVRACAFSEVGALKAGGDASSTLRLAYSSDKPWLALGVSGGLSSPPLYGVRLALDVGGNVPILRYAFALKDPDADLFQVPNVGLFLRLGVVVGVAAL